MAKEFLDFEGLKTYDEQLKTWVKSHAGAQKSQTSYTIPTCIWAGRGCIDLDALKDVDYILIGPSNKRPILWVTSKELKKQTKSLQDLYQQWLDEGNPQWYEFGDDVDFKIRFELFLSRELDITTDVKYTTEDSKHQVYRLGSRYYLKQGQPHSCAVVPKNFVFCAGRKLAEHYFDGGNLDAWKSLVLDTDTKVRYKHERFHKYAKTARFKSGQEELKIKYKYITCFVSRLSKLFDPDNNLSQTELVNQYIVNNPKKEFRVTEIIQNPFHRKVGGCLKVIKDQNGKVLELRRVSKTPLELYEKCLKKVLTFDRRGYNTTALRYKNTILFHHKSPSLTSSWKWLFSRGSSNRKKVFLKRYVVNPRRLGVSRPLKNGQFKIRNLYAAYRNPFYSGLFTYYDVCARVRIRLVNDNLLFPEFEKLRPDGNIRLIYPMVYVRGWFDRQKRIKYFTTSYLPTTARALRGRGKVYDESIERHVSIEEWVNNDTPPFTHNHVYIGNTNNHSVIFHSTLRYARINYRKKLRFCNMMQVYQEFFLSEGIEFIFK